MKLRHILACFAAFVAASIGVSQTANLAADKSAVAVDGDLTFTASVTYEGTPSAMGWSIVLPEGWTYVSTGGPDLPAISPQAGATGTLEWAYTDSPAGVAHFRFTVKAGGKSGEIPVRAKVLLRSGGKPSSAEAAAVSIRVGG